MNVLLIHPEFPDTFWSFKYALKFIRKRAASPPLGLLTVSALLPKTWQQGHPVARTIKAAGRFEAMAEATARTGSGRSSRAGGS